MTCSPSRGWLCRSTPCTSFPPCMRSRLQGSDFYPGGSTSHWTHQFSSGHTIRLLSPEHLVVDNQPSLLRSREPTLFMQSAGVLAIASALSPLAMPSKGVPVKRL